MRKRRLPPVKSKPLRRKGDHPSNPYPVPEKRHEDREGWPFPAPRSPKAAPPAALSDEAQLGKAPPVVAEVAEPTFVLHASDPLAAMLLRCWAGLSAGFCTQHPDTVAEARRTALGMDLWRSKNSGAG